MAEEKLILTQEGYEQLQAEYRHLNDVEAPEARQAVAEARAQGDLSENSEYDAARDRQAKIEARINEIEHMFDIAVIVTPDQVKGNKIGLGSTVTFLELTGEGEGDQITVKLVSTVEADPLAEPPLVSNESLLGKALTGHTTGDHVIVDSADPYEIQIIGFERSK